MIRIKLWDDGGKVVNVRAATLREALTQFTTAVRVKYGTGLIRR